MVLLHCSLVVSYGNFKPLKNTITCLTNIDGALYTILLTEKSGYRVNKKNPQNIYQSIYSNQNLKPKGKKKRICTIYLFL